MVRRSVVGILFCIFLTGSVLLVRNRGQAYRESLRKARRMASADASHRVEQNAEVEIAEAPNAVSNPALAHQDTPSEKPIPGTHAASSAKGARQQTSPSEKTTTIAADSFASASPSQTMPQSPPRQVATSTPMSAEAQAAIARWKSDPFWSRPHLTKQWDLDHFTTQDEKHLGEQLNHLILQLNSEDRGSGLRRVKDTAAPMLELVSRKDITYQFFVLNSEVANAFSHPGGYVYVGRKLLDMIPEDQEHMLEFVLGHEIAHVELRHALKCLQAPDVRSFSDGTLQKLYLLILPHGYPDALEYEADAWVYQQMKRLDRSEHDCLQFLRILDRYAKAHGFEHGRGKPEELLKEYRSQPDGDRVLSPIDNHLRAHPAAYDRQKHLKELKGPTSNAPK
jgi:Peptidase family M48